MMKRFSGLLTRADRPCCRHRRRPLQAISAVALAATAMQFSNCATFFQRELEFLYARNVIETLYLLPYSAVFG